MTVTAQAFAWTADLEWDGDWRLSAVTAAADGLVLAFRYELTSPDYTYHVSLLDITGTAPVEVDTATVAAWNVITHSGAGHTVTWNQWTQDASLITVTGTTITVSTFTTDDGFTPDYGQVALSDDGAELAGGAYIWNGVGYDAWAWGLSTADGTVNWSATYDTPSGAYAVGPCVASSAPGSVIAYYPTDVDMQVLLVGDGGVLDALSLPETGSPYDLMYDPSYWLNLGGGRSAYVMHDGGATIAYRALVASAGSLSWVTAEQTIASDWGGGEVSYALRDSWQGVVFLAPYVSDDGSPHSVYWVDPLATGDYAATVTSIPIDNGASGAYAVAAGATSGYVLDVASDAPAATLMSWAGTAPAPTAPPVYRAGAHASLRQRQAYR